jgi:2-polyprenyl-3-methyl-5-hydroxy-6-metoxy-1,4-benzoquinol methylase
MIKDARLKKHKLGYYEVADKPAEEELNNYYANKYYQEAKDSYEQDYDPDELAYISIKIKQREHVVENLTGKNKGTLLDVGCGEGFTLQHYAERGWLVQGIDYSESGVEKQNPEMRSHVDVGDIYETLSRYQKEERKFDVIYLTNVLEHVLDPTDVLKKIKSIIAYGGILSVTVPNDGSDLQEYCYAEKLIPNRFWIAPPEHLTYFSCQSLQAIAEYTDWTCADLLADFPIDLYLLHQGSNYIQQREQGKSAHRARVALERILFKQDLVEMIAFYRSMAKVGLGRDLTIFLKGK